MINMLVKSGHFMKHSSRHSPARLVSLAWGALQGCPARKCHFHGALTTEGRRPVILIVLFSFLIFLSPRFQFKNLALDENSFKHSDTIWCVIHLPVTNSAHERFLTEQIWTAPSGAWSCRGLSFLPGSHLSLSEMNQDSNTYFTEYLGQFNTLYLWLLKKLY